MTPLRFVIGAAVNVTLQYLVFVIAHASLTTDSMIGLLVAALFQLTVISLVVRAHIRHWRP